MEKEGLEIDPFAQKVVVEYIMNSALLSMVSHNLGQNKVSMIVKMHQN
jgi:hypothetical protein